MQLHIHIADIQPGLRSVLYDIAKYQDSSAFIDCPPGTSGTHLADNCKCVAIMFSNTDVTCPRWHFSPAFVSRDDNPVIIISMGQPMKIATVECMGLTRDVVHHDD